MVTNGRPNPGQDRLSERVMKQTIDVSFTQVRTDMVEVAQCVRQKRTQQRASDQTSGVVPAGAQS